MIRLALIAGAASLALSGGAYVKGRMDGWARRDDAQQVADLAQLTKNQADFLNELRASQQEGAVSARFEADTRQTLGSIQDELTRLSGGIVCPADPDRGVLVDQAVDSANAALRAARAELDGVAGRDPGASPD